MNERVKPPRLKREDWLAIGLRELGGTGPEALRIEALCEVTDKTRGSFYHHFKDHRAFTDALLEHWFQRDTERVITEVEQNPGDKRHALDRLAAGLDERVEMAIRRLAANDATARTVVARVDARRIGYLKDLNIQEFGMAANEALELAEIEYATFVGFQMLFPDANQSKYEAVGRRLDAMVRAGSRAGRD